MWSLKDQNYSEINRASKEATFTLGNGYFGVRGFFEEEQEGLLSLGGIYMAGIFGDGNLEAWNGKNRELVNVPNFLAVKILCDGEVVEQKDYTEYQRSLDIQHGILTRSYVWKNKLKLEFERFVSITDMHTVCQQIRFTPLVDCVVEVETLINTENRNLNKVSCEPLPIQPGDKHYTVLEKAADRVVVETDGIAPEKMIILQQTELADNVFTRIVQAYTSRDAEFEAVYGKFAKCEKQNVQKTEEEPERAAEQKACLARGAGIAYDAYKEAHSKAWEIRWSTADIQFEKDAEDQLALRYSLFHLMQVCPNKDSRISIGARGLTGEMYEGCVFWDTEIFKLPFFIFENPEAARELLRFRYNMLPAAREHAKELWFEGAMYPWQSCNLGFEQTEKNVGAFYAIHIICDIAYALMQYFRATDDMDFMVECGAEILMETSRFWASRVTKRAEGHYDLMAVRGPNEYDVIVDNNSYTNMMVQENLKSALNIAKVLQEDYPEQWAALCKKIGLEEKEFVVWEDIAEHITICYDRSKNLYLEDATYADRVPLDLKKAKPTGKRIIDSTMPYEALPLYQVTKQADVICLMNNLPLHFTKEEKQAAWDYYEPKTAHDSSLSYCSYSVMAARLGMDELAYRYFRTCAYLDIEDIKLNNISGLHFANFGGTWQAVVYGFAGLSISGDTIILEPNMPEKWGKVSFHVIFKGNLIKVEAEGKHAKAEVIEFGERKVAMEIR